MRDRARYPSEAENRRAQARSQSRALRVRALAHYGCECNKCGSTERLELDHVHGNGELHRDRVGHGDAFYRYLVRNEFPAECDGGGEFSLQLLCPACHRAKTTREREGR